ncbi:MAG TPA: efflux RND transporter periplasmic adaptor subunit [Chitinophagaceae bacterium]
MKQLISYTFFIAAIAAFAGCGKSDKKINATITEKKTELGKKKNEQTKLAEEIRQLEEELARIDTGAAKISNAKLVSVMPLATGRFEHFIELQGKIEADNISYVTPKYGGGQVRAVYVSQGQQVRRGQLLLKLDDAIVRQQLVAARSGLNTLQTQLNTARDIYNRQSNLWKQGIGTEVQLIQARTNVATLESQLTTARENVKTIERQLDGTNVRADVSGVADVVNVRVGEFFQGFLGNAPQIVIVNSSSLKAVAMVPETYASRVKIGSPVQVVLPDLGNQSYNSKISISGRQISLDTRSFEVEAKIPYNASIRPNQIAKLRIQDYAVANTMIIPVNTVQTDEKGKYVFVAVQEGDRTVARKKPIGVGELNGEMIEVRVGLKPGDRLITEGYQNLYEGQVISVVR